MKMREESSKEVKQREAGGWKISEHISLAL